jgi:uncharacterized protein
MTDETPLQTPRTTVRRLSKRAAYDRATVERILDEGLVCHVAFVADGQPYLIPMTYGRAGGTLFVHGSAASRMLRAVRDGAPLALAVTLLDGLVLARSAFHHSMNYRSVVVLGTAREVTDPEEKRRALDVIVEHVCRGRAQDTRPASQRELDATLVLALPIVEASAKTRSGPPLDDAEDLGLPYWAGELPLRIEAGEPVPEPGLAREAALPDYVADYRRP